MRTYTKDDEARARSEWIRQELRHTSNDADKRLLQNGYIKDTDKYNDEIDLLAETMTAKGPLSFPEITSYATWFFLHPEKVAGQTKPNSSIYFPTKTHGSREDIDKVFANLGKGGGEAERLRLIAVAQMQLRARKRKKLALRKK